MALETFALVIMLSGWVQGGSAARGNAMDHISGFTSMEKCENAGHMVQTTSINPSVVKTVCVESAEEPETGNVLVIVMNGWDEVGSGSRGNVIHHLSGYKDQQTCKSVGDKIRDSSTNKGILKTSCLEL